MEAKDPVENLLRRHLELDPADGSHWTGTADILTALQADGLQGATRAKPDPRSREQGASCGD